MLKPRPGPQSLVNHLTNTGIAQDVLQEPTEGFMEHFPQDLLTGLEHADPTFGTFNQFDLDDALTGRTPP